MVPNYETEATGQSDDEDSLRRGPSFGNVNNEHKLDDIQRFVNPYQKMKRENRN